MIHRIYGKCTEENGAIRLDADRATATKPGNDGIGCALCFYEWDGSSLRLETERVECWRDEPWADLWFVAREHSPEFGAKFGKIPTYPLRYLRFTADTWEMGQVLGRKPRAPQRIHVTARKWERKVPAGVYHVPGYNVSWGGGVLHIEPYFQKETFSLVAPVCELGLYCEGSVVRVGLTPPRPLEGPARSASPVGRRSAPVVRAPSAPVPRG